MRILIAEDDLTSRIILEEMLKLWGHAAVVTTDGAEAWDMLQRPDAPRMVILDWMMPQLDGLDVVRRVRARPSETPPYIILLTTRGDCEDIATGLKAGADDYLAKPFDAGELQARIEVGARMLALQERLGAQVIELRQALEQIKTLKGILPICSFCNCIRNDQGAWDKLEAYVSRHSEASFSHSICPDCMRKHYPEESEDS